MESPVAGIDCWLAVPAIAATLLTLSIALICACQSESKSSARLAAIKSESCIELNADHVENALSVGSISTINVYRGDIGVEVVARLKNTLKHVIELNPWLAGTLAPSVNTGATALYVPHAHDAELELGEIFFETVEVQLTSELPHAELEKIAGQYAVDGGVQAAARGRTRGKVFAVAALHGAGGEFSAVSISMSHTIADEYTFYRVYRMLAGTEPIACFDATRHSYGPSRSAARMAWLRNGPLFAFHLFSRFRPGVVVGPLRLDNRATSALKAEHAPTADVPFISSTDIHTSEFCRALKPDAALIKVNPRGRRHHAGDNASAGNWLVLLSDEFEEAHKIRWFLRAPSLPVRKDLPSPPRSLLWSIGLVSSWRFGPTELPLVGCEQLVHLPSLRGWPALRRWVCLFTPKEGVTAALVHAPDKETAAAILRISIVAGVLTWD